MRTKKNTEGRREEGGGGRGPMDGYHLNGMMGDMRLGNCLLS